MEGKQKTDHVILHYMGQQGWVPFIPFQCVCVFGICVLIYMYNTSALFRKRFGTTVLFQKHLKGNAPHQINKAAYYGGRVVYGAIDV